MKNEPLFFMQPFLKEPPTTRLMFVPDSDVTISLWDGSMSFKEGEHFVVDKATRKVTMVEPYAMPFTTAEALFPSSEDPSPSKMAHRKNHPEQYMLWSEGPLFQQSQVLASYSESEFEVSFWEKSWNTGSLKTTKKRLVEGRQLKIAVTGDSISAGYNASGFLKRQPYEPSYPERFCQFLEEKYKTKVTMQNFAVGGWSSNNGLEKVGAPASMSPNLLIVAFGMNDTGKTSPDLYASNIIGIIDRVKSNAPDCEVILVSPMVPNFEWHCKKEEDFVALRNELIKICNDSIVLADCYSLFKKIAQKKSYYDITGNGLNHPNDFGHKLYADLLIRSIS